MSHQGQQLSAPAERAHEIEQVLLGLADGSYVLSTPDGAVAECGVGVVALLGVPAEELAGRRTADALVPGADAETRAAFEALLDADGAAGAATRVFRTTTRSGVQRSLAFVVVAVPLALGWEFTSLLGELGSRDAGTWHPEALRLRHGRALEAIEGVCISGAQPDPGARLAGILIVVRDVDAPALTREDVGRRMAEQREAARAAAAEAARRADAATGRSAVGGELFEDDDGPGLEDLVERARILRERVEDAEREAATAKMERERALAQLAAARAEHAAETERREAGDGRAGELARERDEAAARANSAREAARQLQAELGAATGELEGARSEIAMLRTQLTALHGELDRAQRELGVARGEELAGAVADRDALREQLQLARDELDGTRAELESTRAELESTLAAAEGARAEREQARLRASQLLSEAEAARAAADAIRAEFAFDDPRPVHGGVGAPAASAGLGSAANGAPAPARPAEPALALPPAGPGEALALIGLDGTFKRLDDAFCSLLGCREEDLRAARWPSIIDRENLAAHQEIARALRAGEIQSAPVETVYMHAYGLLVPIAGTVSMHCAAGSGPATHYLFRAEVSRTSGGA